MEHELENELYSYFFQNAPQPCVIFNKDFEIFKSNSVFARIFGSTVTLSDIFPEKNKNEYIKLLSQYNLKQKNPHHLKLRSQTNKILASHVVLNKISLNSSDYFMMSVYFISEPDSETTHMHNELSFRLIFEHASVAFSMIDRNGNFLDVNSKTCEYFEQSREKLLNSSLFEFITNESAKKLASVFTKLHKMNTVKDQDITISLSKKNPKFFSITLTKVTDNLFFIVYFDLTKEKYMQDLHKFSEERYKQLFESAPDGIMIEDLNGKLIDVNDQFCKIFGYSRSEMLNMNIRNLVDSSYYAEIENGFNEVKKKKMVFKEVVNKHKNGNDIYLALTESLITLPDGEKAIQVHIRDISDKIKSEKALRESEEKHRLLVESLHEGFFILEEGQITYINQNCAQILDRPVNQIIGKPFIDFVLAKHKNNALKKYKNLQEKTDHPVNFTISVIRPDGSDRIVDIYLNNSYLNKKVTTFGVIKDLTEYKILNHKLQLQKSFLENIINSAPIAIHIIDTKTGASYIHNDAFKKLFRIYSDDFFKTYNFWKDSTFNDDFKEIIKEIKESGKVRTIPDYKLLFSGLKSPIFVKFTGFPISNHHNNVSHIVIMIENVTEYKLLEDQLLQAQKMESVGTLASGMAHDFNNLLGGIIGYASLLKDTLPENNHLRSYADKIEKTGNRAAELTQKLLMFSRKKRIDVGPLDIKNSVLNVLDLLVKNLNKNIKLKTQIDEVLQITSGDSGQIEQVIMNLCMNSIDAMPNGGTLSIRTYEIQKKMNPMIIPQEDPFDNFIVLEIKDTGHGIPADVIDKIYEPFFTTKEMGKGTGLGLSLVFNIVKNHNGYINVKSTHNIGTTFWVYLPVRDPDIKSNITEDNMDKKDMKKEITILIIDDEVLIRDLIRDSLDEMGYKTIEAENGTVAFQIYKEIYQKIDLVIIDMIMPGPNGLETFRSLKNINPAIKAILATGYSDDTEIEKILKEGVIKVLYKPFNFSKLQEYIKNVFNI